jgi:hypothetical protein
MRTFDNRGMGDLSPDVQAQLDADVASGAGAPAPVGSPSNPLQLPTMTVTAAPVSFSLAQLLQPPYIYFVVAALGLAAYLYRGKRS